MPSLVRAAKSSDAEALADIHSRTWQHAYRGIVPDSLLDQISIQRRTQQWLSWLIEPNPGSAVLLAEVDGTIAGFVLLGRSRDDDANDAPGEVMAIYVLPQFQGHRLGAALMSAGLSSLRDSGYLQATLWVLEKNLAAQGLYERYGWTSDGSTKTEELGEGKLVEIRYRTDLGTEEIPL